MSFTRVVFPLMAVAAALAIWLAFLGERREEAHLHSPAFQPRLQTSHVDAASVHGLELAAPREASFDASIDESASNGETGDRRVVLRLIRSPNGEWQVAMGDAWIAADADKVTRFIQTLTAMTGELRPDARLERLGLDDASALRVSLLGPAAPEADAGARGPELAAYHFGHILTGDFSRRFVRRADSPSLFAVRIDLPAMLGVNADRGWSRVSAWTKAWVDVRLADIPEREALSLQIDYPDFSMVFRRADDMEGTAAEPHDDEDDASLPLPPSAFDAEPQVAAAAWVMEEAGTPEPYLDETLRLLWSSLNPLLALDSYGPESHDPWTPAPHALTVVRRDGATYRLSVTPPPEGEQPPDPAQEARVVASERSGAGYTLSPQAFMQLFPSSRDWHAYAPQAPLPESIARIELAKGGDVFAFERGADGWQSADGSGYAPRRAAIDDLLDAVCFWRPEYFFRSGEQHTHVFSEMAAQLELTDDQGRVFAYWLGEAHPYWPGRYVAIAHEPYLMYASNEEAAAMFPDRDRLSEMQGGQTGEGEGENG